MTAITKEQIESGEYTQDDILDYYDNLYNNNLHREALKKLPQDKFDEIDTQKDGDYDYTIGTKDGVSVIIDQKGFFGRGLLERFGQNQIEAAETKTKAMQEVGQGIKNFSEGTVFGLAKAYNNTKIILNEASGGKLQQFENFVNQSGKDLLDIDVKIPIDSLKPKANTLGTMGGEITGQYIIPGAFVYKYIPNIIAAEVVTVGLFSGKNDGNLASAIKEMAPNFAENNEVAKIILDGLSVDADDSEVEARIKNVTADAPLGILFGGLFSMLKYFKKNPDKLEEVQSEYKDAGAAATPEALISGYTSTQPFYSNVVNAIRDIDIPEGGMDITQFTNTIKNKPGIKQSELDDMGFDEFFLDDKPAIVTQERVNEFLETKDLSKNVNTTVLGEADNPNTNEILKNRDMIDVSLVDTNSYEDAELIVMNNERLYNEFQDFIKDIKNTTNRQDIDLIDEDDFLEEFLKTRGIAKQPSTLPTKFEEYTLPGGEDYKEMLLTSKGTQIFTKDHFRRAGAKGVPEGENVLAHIRFNTRDINGKKVLFIEEIQSDLHQTGRRLGYTNKNILADTIKINDELTKLFKRKRELEQNLSSLPKDEYNATKELISEIDDRYNQLINQRESFVTSGKIPDAPFKKNWHELSMKRIIKYAIDNGFEGISFTPASVQAERYPGEAGQSLATFYDTILPKFVNKFSKKYGAKLDTARLGDEGGVPEYYDDVVDSPEIDEIYFPNDNTPLQIRQSKFGDVYDVMQKGGLYKQYKTEKEAQEGLIELYNKLRAEDYLKDGQDVPYLEFTPEMINTIKSEGVPVAAVKDRKTSATRTV